MTKQELINSFENGRLLFTYNEVKNLVKRKKRFYSITELIPYEELMNAYKKRKENFKEEDLPDFMK